MKVRIYLRCRIDCHSRRYTVATRFDRSIGREEIPRLHDDDDDCIVFCGPCTEWLHQRLRTRREEISFNMMDGVVIHAKMVQQQLPSTIIDHQRLASRNSNVRKFTRKPETPFPCQCTKLYNPFQTFLSFHVNGSGHALYTVPFYSFAHITYIHAYSGLIK